MTALERALVVYAEAKGYEIETKKKTDGRPAWRIKEPDESFKFRSQFYRIKDLGTAYMVYCELANSFGGQYPKTITPNHERTWNIEDLKKHKPAGFSCKTKMYTREEIEEMNKPKEEEFDVKAYVKSLVQTPEYLERCKEVDPIIEVLDAYKRGEEIECWDKYKGEWIKLNMISPIWDFVENRYRIAPKQPEAIPATEEELKEIEAEKNNCFWVKDKLSGVTWKFYQMGADILKNFYVFNSISKTWQDWGSK